MFCGLCIFQNTGGTYMARNRITGRETQKMQEYTQERIAQAERRDIEFPTDVKEQIFEICGNLDRRGRES